MSNFPSFFCNFECARLKPLAAPIVIATALAGCSTDVQRFGHTGSLAPTSTVGAAPVGAVERVPLGPATGPTRSRSDTSYATAVTPASAVSVASVQSYSRSGGAGSVIVEPGDTAFSIARRNRVSVQQLAAANDLGYLYDIKIGQRLTIPGAGSPAAAIPAPVRAAAASTGSHTVVPGDTLFNISRRYGVGVASLAKANSLDNQGSIKIGQTLRLPSGSSPSAVAAGGPLKLAVRSTGTANDAGARILRSRAVESAEPAANTSAEASLVPASGTPDTTRLLPPASATTASKFRWPARGRIISHYGVATDGKRNDGINISVPVGASVKAAEGGVVAYAGDELKGYGNLILIRHANDLVTAYAHNSSILVNRGEQVKRGQIIAKAGQSGSVDKPQLHFEVRQGSKAVDPMPYLEGA